MSLKHFFTTLSKKPELLELMCHQYVDKWINRDADCAQDVSMKYLSEFKKDIKQNDLPNYMKPTVTNLNRYDGYPCLRTNSSQKVLKSTSKDKDKNNTFIESRMSNAVATPENSESACNRLFKL